MPKPSSVPAGRRDTIQDSLITRLACAFARRGQRLYLVGGTIRDLLLGRPTADLDFTTAARPGDVRRAIEDAGGHPFDIGQEFGTVGGTFSGVTVEITTFRSETYQPGSRKPEVQFGDDLAGDLSRRDFTINAIAEDALTGERFDLFGGERDLQARLVRAVGDPDSRFAEDPLRLMRAVRLVAQLGFEIEPETRAAIRRQAATLANVSRERIQTELNKLLVSSHPDRGIRELCDLGLMEAIFAEVLEMRGMRQDDFHHKDVFEHTLQVVADAPDTLELRLAALLHDIAKPRTRSVEDGAVHFFGHDRVGAQMARAMLARLRYPNDTTDHVSRLVELHLRPNAYEPGWTDGAVRRFMREAGPLLDDLLALSRADVTTRHRGRRDAARARVEELRGRVEKIRAREDVLQIKSPLDGHDLMAMFGRRPGPWIQPIKDRLLALVLDGGLAEDDRARAEELARAFYAEQEHGQDR